MCGVVLQGDVQWEDETMPQSLPPVDFSRRAMLWGLAGASVLVMGEAWNMLAQGAMEPERKVIKEAESVIPNFPKIRLREMTFQPGAQSTRTMDNPMICEITRGALVSKVDGQPVTRNTGDIYTCKIGQVIENENKGNTVAVMRVFDLLPS
ncbi:MAG TPA: hypothetical protein VLK82_05385 [Candidatus Tectomicrobia bacterium]|nr:hypothetical protein [Candidatus Tectomicrobia bacterium]